MSHWKITLVLVFLIALSGGCSSKRTLIPTPHIYSDTDQQLFQALDPALETNLVDVMYVTDRLPEGKKKGILEYSHKRSSSLAYGYASVEFGGNHSWADLVRLSTEKTAPGNRPSIKVVAIEERGRFPATPYDYRVIGKGDRLELDPAVVEQREQIMDQVREDILQRLSRTAHKELYVFIHGINYQFNDAVEVVAEGWHFFGREGVAIAYTWPAGSGGLFNYAYDRESGEYTIFHLKNFIRFITSIQAVNRVHFIAHSRGTDVIMTALRELWIESRAAGVEPRATFKIGNVVLIAPDLDFEVSMQRLVAESVGAMFNRLTIYSNKRDDALGAAKLLFSSWLRVGAMQKDKLTNQQRTTIRQLVNIDIVSYQGSTGGSFGHNYFLDNPAVSSDIIALLRYDWPPGKENGRPLENLGGNFWRIDDDYLSMEALASPDSDSRS